MRNCWVFMQTGLKRILMMKKVRDGVIVPWSQKEMEVTEEMLDCARSNDVSLVIIGRTAR